jgi:hypothetical protein
MYVINNINTNIAYDYIREGAAERLRAYEEAVDRCCRCRQIGRQAREGMDGPEQVNDQIHVCC